MAALILGLLVASVPSCAQPTPGHAQPTPDYAQPTRYVATSMLQVHSTVPSFLGNDRPLNEREYNRFMNTQIALLTSPPVLDRALEHADVAQLPIVLEQKDKRAWLAKELRIEASDLSEIIYVRITTNSAEASEKINNAVVTVYLNFIDEVARRANNELIGNLRIEDRRQRQLATTFQDNIRRRTREATLLGVTAGDSIGLVQGESLVRDIVLAEAKLTAMKAQRKGIIERMVNPIPMPISLLIQLNPELKFLNEQRSALYQQRTMLAETFSNPDDPRIEHIGRQIAQIEERVKTLASGADNSTLEAAMEHFRFQEEVNLYQLDLEIRVQEILVAELTSKYQEQLLKSVERTENMLDATFEQSQLERVHRTLDRIEDLIFAITTEQRAPAQITLLSRTVVSEVNE